MSEEKIIKKDIKKSTEKYLYNQLNLKKEQEVIKNFIFSNIIKMINQKERFILGPEKLKIARFISQNYINVYVFLDTLLKNYNLEGFE